MTAVNCPMCELRFTSKNERDWHLRNEHQHPHVRPPADAPAALRWHRPEPGPREAGRDRPDEEAGARQPRP
jgi:hypothetical protein